ncbi:putative ATP-dependent DNA ligase ykoU [Tanacetum coccineum]
MSILKIIPSNIKDICLIISFFSLFYLISHPLPSPLPTTVTTVVQPPSTTAHRHVFYSIASSSKSYLNRQPYLRLWYTPNLTNAAVFLDRPVTGVTFSDQLSGNSKFSGDFSDLPPVVISGDTSRFPYTFPRGLRSAIRVARIVKETVELFDTDEIRWYVFGDDDTVFMTENIVRVLNKYDYRKWYYIGSNSESYEQNFRHSFDMAFGGGGFAISRSLGKVLASVLDSCLMRYPHVYGSDSRVYSCLVELGVELTNEPGFHQVKFAQLWLFMLMI